MAQGQLTQVTDPKLLALLNSDEPASAGMVMNGLKPEPDKPVANDLPPDLQPLGNFPAPAQPPSTQVTDPALLAQLNAPDEAQAPAAQLQAAFDAKKAGLLDRIGNDFNNRKADFQAQQGAYQAGNQGLARTTLRTAGDMAAVPNDALGQVAGSVNSAIAPILPYIPIIGPAQQAGKSVLNSIASSDIANKISSGVQNLGKEYPEAAKDVSAAGNILGLASSFTPVEGVSVSGKASDLAIDAGKVGLSKADMALGTTVRPTQADLKAASQANYATADKVGGLLSPKFNDDFINYATSFRPKDAMAQALEGENPAHKALSVLEDFRGQPMTLDRAASVDQSLTKMLEDKNMTDKNGVLNSYGQQVLSVKNKLRDDLLSAADNGNVQGGREGIDAYRTAVKDWAAQSQLSDINRIVDKASYMDNPATALKTGFRAIAANPARLNKYPKEVQAAIKNAARDGDIANILRTELGSRLISTVTGGLAGSTMGPVGTILGTAAGFAGSRAARAGAESMQMGRVNKVVDAIASRSSLQTKRVPFSDRFKSAPAIEAPISAQPQQLLLAAPDKMSGIPMTPEQIAQSQAVLRKQAGTTGGIKNIDPKTGLPVGDVSGGAKYGFTPQQVKSLIRVEPSEAKAIQSFRDNVGPDWDRISKSEQDKIESQIDALWKSNKQSAVNVAKTANENASTLAQETGDKLPETDIAIALRNALKRADQKDALQQEFLKRKNK